MDTLDSYYLEKEQGKKDVELEFKKLELSNDFLIANSLFLSATSFFVKFAFNISISLFFFFYNYYIKNFYNNQLFLQHSRVDSNHQHCG